jgi:hypothetical protein
LCGMPHYTHRARRGAHIAAAVVSLIVVNIPGALHAQATGAGDTAAAPPAARPADVASMDAILHSLYDVISGPAGPRDWQRFRSLFVPGARLIPTRHDSTGHVSLRVWSPEEYAATVGPRFMQTPFYEHQIGQTVETFGAVTQVFSAYASRHAPTDPEPFARGINSIQLFNDGTRWYVVTIYWDSERGGTKIPGQYLTGQ